MNYKLNIIKLIIILYLLPSSAFAGYLDINLFSWHYDKTYNYNGVNLGVGYTEDLNKYIQALGGFYINSYKKNSFYLMAKFKYDIGDFAIGVNAGFVTGYDNIALTKEQVSKLKHLDSDREHKKHYRPKNQKPASLKNMDVFQFAIVPTINYKISFHHKVEFAILPDYSKNSAGFIGVKYQYRFN